MPQMSPMWWEMLFIMFILLYLNMITLLYFNYNKNITSTMMKKMNLMMNWKW